MQLLCRKCGKAAALLDPSGPRQLLLDRQRHRPSNVMEGRCLFYRSRFRLASLFLLVLAIVVALENHGVCFLPFFFCVQFDLDAVSLWGVWFKIWLVLHEPLKELVGGFGGEEGHGKQLLSGE